MSEKAYRIGRPTRRIEYLVEQEQRVELLRRAIMKHGGMRRLVLASRCFSVNGVKNWLSGNVPIPNEHVQVLKGLAGEEGGAKEEEACPT